MTSDRLKAIFSESQVMVLVEEFNSNLKLVFEGFSALDRKIDTAVESLTERIDHVDYKVEVLNKKIDDVEQRLSTRIDDVEQRLSGRIDGVEQHLSDSIDGVASEIAAHRNNTELHSIEKRRSVKRA